MGPVPDTTKRRCVHCAYFLDDPVELERALTGILILSSGQGDTRGDQGLCLLHDRLLLPTMTCDRFEKAAVE